MALDYERRGKDGSSNWAQHYLIDPLHEVEAWQTAQTGGQYNNKLPTQHKHVTNSEFYEQPSTKSGSGGGLGRSISLRIGSSKKEKERTREADENEESGIKRKTSMRNRLIRRFTDEGKDRRYATLRPLNEVPDKEIQNRENVDLVSRTPRSEARKVVDGANIENMPVSKKEAPPASNNPFRDSMQMGNTENLTPPSSPPRPESRQVASNNPFRDSMQGAEYLTPPSSPKRPHSRGNEQRTPPRNLHRSNGPRSPHRPPTASGSRSAARPPSSNATRRPPSRNQHKPSQVRGVAADTIDILDTSFYGMTFHHEGPYDATLAHKNRNPKKSPVEATKVGNSMALKATAKADLDNSLVKGRPLDGVAAFPPGTVAPGGEVMQYEEYDVMVLDGKFRRWPNERYTDDDIKGKGVEGYEADLRRKQEKEHRRGKSLEMKAYPSPSTSSSEVNGKNGDTTTVTFVDDGNGLKRGGSTSGRLEGAAAKIKRTFSLKRREKRETNA